MELITLLAIVCLIMVAIAFSPLGLGGGILYVPIMHYMLNWEMRESLVASLTLVLMVSIGSSLAHSRSGFADKDAAKLGRVSAAPSAVIGVLLSGVLLSVVGDIGIKIIAVIIISFVIERTLRKSLSVEHEYQDVKLTDNRNRYILGSSFAGISSGILGIGGGAILVTVNRSIMKMDSKKAAGTSYMVVSVTVPIALASHLIMSNNLDTIIEKSGLIPMLTIPILVLLSAYYGAKYAIKILPKKVVTGAFLLVISISLIRYSVDFYSLL